MLNFTREILHDWLNPPTINGLTLISSNFFNITAIFSDPNWFFYYDQPTEYLKHLATLAVFQETPAAASNASNKACGHGWDCNFTVKFMAPGYKCDDIIDRGVPAHDMSDIRLPFDPSVLLPEGIYSYHALTYLGDYADQQLENISGLGVPDFGPPWPEHLGVFRTEPVLWIGYSSMLLPFDQILADRTAPSWNVSFAPNIIRCENYETEYTVKFEYVGGLQNIQVLHRRYIAPILNTRLTQNTTNDGTEDTIVAVPESAYVYPKDRRYHYVAAYHSFDSVFRKHINGTMDAHMLLTPLDSTEAAFTRLFNPKEAYFPFPDLKQRMQSMFENIILSVFSNPQFTIVTWAAAPDRPVGPLQSDGTSGYPCTRSKAQNRFRYHAQDLWLVYGVSLGFAVAAVAMGTMSVVQNKGVLKNTRYLSIAVLLQHCGIEYDVLGARSKART